MIKLIKKSGILLFLGVFLIIAYVEGISIEPLAALKPLSSSNPNNYSGSVDFLKEKTGASAGGIKGHSSSSWQSDNKKHKSQDHSEEELMAWTTPADRSSVLITASLAGINETAQKLPEQINICCRS